LIRFLRLFHPREGEGKEKGGGGPEERRKLSSSSCLLKKKKEKGGKKGDRGRGTGAALSLVLTFPPRKFPSGEERITETGPNLGSPLDCGEKKRGGKKGGEKEKKGGGGGPFIPVLFFLRGGRERGKEKKGGEGREVFSADGRPPREGGGEGNEKNFFEDRSPNFFFLQRGGGWGDFLAVFPSSFFLRERKRGGRKGGVEK